MVAPAGDARERHFGQAASTTCWQQGQELPSGKCASGGSPARKPQASSAGYVGSLAGTASLTALPRSSLAGLTVNVSDLIRLMRNFQLGVARAGEGFEIDPFSRTESRLEARLLSPPSINTMDTSSFGASSLGGLF